jgi:hypothetical protein|tara:strand:- start:946 stop:1320 length:375 start_codon:yes stop_codon:yes gene_type:complete
MEQIGGWLNFNHLVFNYDKKGYPMSYTKAEEQSIRDNAPVTYEKAEELASQFGKTIRSVVSKSVSLKVYQKREQSRSVTKPQKKDTIRAIEKTFGCEQGRLDGLANARGETLKDLFQLIAETVG